MSCTRHVVPVAFYFKLVLRRIQFVFYNLQLNEAVKNAPSTCLNRPVVKTQLGPMHWEKLEAINEALTAEYGMRRSMLLKRVDVTVASFNWSDRAKVTDTHKPVLLL